MDGGGGGSVTPLTPVRRIGTAQDMLRGSSNVQRVGGGPPSDSVFMGHALANCLILKASKTTNPGPTLGANETLWGLARGCYRNGKRRGEFVYLFGGVSVLLFPTSAQSGAS